MPRYGFYGCSRDGLIAATDTQVCGKYGLENGKGVQVGKFRGGNYFLPPPHKTTQFVFGQFNFGFFEVVIDCAYVPHDSSSLIKPRVLLNWMK